MKELTIPQSVFAIQFSQTAHEAFHYIRNKSFSAKSVVKFQFHSFTITILYSWRQQLAIPWSFFSQLSSVFWLPIFIDIPGHPCWSFRTPLLIIWRDNKFHSTVCWSGPSRNPHDAHHIGISATMKFLLSSVHSVGLLSPLKITLTSQSVRHQISTSWSWAF